METKHTPGPWQAVTFSDEDVPCIIDAEGDGRIAELNGNQTVEETAANARLIASAPALLEALKAAKRVLETAKQYFPKSIRNSDTFSLLNVIANSVNPAIAQAEGE